MSHNLEQNNGQASMLRNQILYLHDDIPEAAMHKGTLFGSRGYPFAVWPLFYFILHPEKTKTTR